MPTIRLLILSFVLAPCFVFASLLLISCQQKTESLPAMTGPVVDSVASSDGVMIYYEVGGEGEPALVFVHGWSCDRSYWREQVDEFARTYKVVALDMGGHGESGLGREDWTLAAFGADVAAVVNKLDLDKVVLMGHSMAGSVIVQASMQLPGRVIGLVGVDTYHKLEMEFTPEQIATATAPFRADFVPAVDGFVRNMFHKNADSALVSQVAADMSAAPPEIAINVVENYLRVNPVDMLKEVKIPIRAINAEKPVTEVETNKKYATSFEVRLMPNVGHLVQLEDPTTFNRLLHEIIEELIGLSDKPDDKE
jgi:pimeloyl-ACP methyl ester carboxylesterase